MSDNMLVLHPADINFIIPEIKTFEQNLRAEGFISDEFDYFSQIHFMPGNSFFEFIDFDHSHRVVLINGQSISPENAPVVDSRTQCDICIPPSTTSIEFLGGAYLLPPLCPNCHYEHADPVDLLCIWYDHKNDFTIKCPGCESNFSIDQLDWQEAGGFGKQQIQIWGIHTGEATPSVKFLSLLKKLTGTEWIFLYYHL
jgi:hypothetical protein